MADTNPSANMALPIPVVGVDTGPDWAENINSCFTILDQHNHTPGLGNAVPPSGLNINADLTFQNNDATELRSARFTTQASPLSDPTDLGCLYESGVDLYFNDGNGNQVRITQSGAVAGSPGSISSLTSPASASYSAVDAKFVWQSDSNVAASLDCRNLILRNSSASSKGLTLSPPSAMAADITMKFPTIPAATSFMRMDSAGNMSSDITVDNSTIAISSSQLIVKTGGITATQIANNTITASQIANATITTTQISASAGITGSQLANTTITSTQLASNAVTTAKITDQNVTQAKMQLRGVSATGAAGDFAISTVCTSFGTSSTSFVDVTNLTVDLTTLGNPIYCQIVSRGGANDSSIAGARVSTTGNISVYLQFVANGTTIARFRWQRPGATTSDLLMVGPTVSAFYASASASTYTIKVQAAVDSGSQFQLDHLQFIAYEIK